MTATGYEPMRAVAALSAVLVALSFPSQNAAAQAADHDERPGERLAQALEQHQAQSAPDVAPGWRTRVLSAVGGAAIGAGLGFFASQIATGDWEPRARKVAVDRPAWAAVGGSVGLALGFSFPLSAGPPAQARPLPSLQRSSIDRGELRELGTTHAYEAVEVLRPEWLHDRGPTEFGDTPADGLSVYVEGTRIGNLSELRTLSTDDIQTIRFIDASTATSRWGAGNARGALLVILRGA